MVRTAVRGRRGTLGALLTVVCLVAVVQVQPARGSVLRDCTTPDGTGIVVGNLCVSRRYTQVGAAASFFIQVSSRYSETAPAASFAGVQDTTTGKWIFPHVCPKTDFCNTVTDYETVDPAKTIWAVFYADNEPGKANAEVATIHGDWFKKP